MSAPSFFVVGAQKAGTTTLHESLSRHPDVQLPSIKETHYFRDADKFERGESWYRAWFPEPVPGAVVGEIDPDYLYVAEAPARMRRMVQRPRLVYVFRDPLERAYSQFRMSRRRGFETLEFADALRAEPERLASGERHALIHQGYMARGRYAEQLERFRGVFPESPELLCDFHRLFDRGEGAEQLDRLCRFLGLSTPPAAEPTRPRANPGGASRSRLVRDLIYRPSRLKRWGRRLVRSERGRLALAQWLDRINRRPEAAGDDWRATVPAEVRDEAARQIDALERVSGLRFDHWRTRAEAR